MDVNNEDQIPRVDSLLQAELCINQLYICLFA